MRITNSMITSQYLSDLNGNLNRMSKYLQQETTGKLVNKISDDPVRAVQSLMARGKLSAVEQYKNSISSVKNSLTEAESAVDELNDIVTNAYDKTLAAVTGTLNEEDREALSQEIAQMRDEILTVGNVTLGDNYLFAGYDTAGSAGLPFTVDSNGDLIYNGLNMSSEASGKHISSAVVTAAKALADATAANTTAAGADSSQYYVVTNAVQSVADAVSTLADASGDAVTNARDLAKMAGIDPADYTSLTGAADTAEASRAAAKGAAKAAADAVSLADSTAQTADAAYTAWQEAKTAVPYDADTEASAHTDYLNAAAAAESAADDAKAASGAAVSAAAAAKTDMDSLNSVAAGIVAPVSDALDVVSGQAISLQVGAGQSMETSFSGTGLLGRGEENVYVILDELYQALNTGAGSSELSGFVTRLQNKQSDVLTLNTRLGAMQNRISSISTRYTQSTLSYKEMQSDAEDVDMAKAIENFATAKTVYDAALASGAQILQNSLLDFIS